MQIQPILLVAAGGAIGAVCRYLTTGAITSFFGKEFPYGTITVNIIGSFLIGLLTSVLSQNYLEPQLKLLLITGLLGGFTTFSTFSLDTVNLIHASDYIKLFLYIAGSIVLGVGAAVTGLLIGEAIKAH
ncbi:fluoride efflux transporter CrcB [Ruminobacter sp. RM87]|jgi:CrcB protein|uniref:fluoride efflux transporter CrcB n=1 Tax=Ruminobacter sp. RM87 TaxID=1200567 RepID=UPI0004E1AB5A|nr:fluoride efflux transporter CrcB [Ruminobacter sp. RM87]